MLLENVPTGGGHWGGIFSVRLVFGDGIFLPCSQRREQRKQGHNNSACRATLLGSSAPGELPAAPHTRGEILAITSHT